MNDYQHQDSTLTLREGLRDYFRSNPDLIDPEDPEQAGAAAAELFRYHDRIHVVFGTDTTIRQEAMTDTWAMAGSTVGVRGYSAYASEPEVIGILKDIGVWRTITESVKAVPAMFGVIRRSRKMTKKWPWKENDAWLDVPLAEIRREFGIQVFQPKVGGAEVKSSAEPMSATPN